MADDVVAVRTYLLTYNPKVGPGPGLSVDLLAEWVQATEAQRLVRDSWSTGGTKRIKSGDRAFLLQQGTEPRGIFASGVFDSDVREGVHLDDPTRTANFADIEWDTVLDPEDCLPTGALRQAIPDAHWSPQASGSSIEASSAAKLERLWAAHVASVRGSRTPRRGHVSAVQGRQLDAQHRKQIEDLAQDRLTQAYEAEGWRVTDRRAGNPFDALARHPDGRVLYLEAKGTTTRGDRVTVTRGEVNWARNHPGECIIGVLSGIAIVNGQVDEDSGTLHCYPWDAHDDQLTPIEYHFRPSASNRL